MWLNFRVYVRAYLAQAFAVCCIREIPCVSTRRFDFSTVHELSSKEKISAVRAGIRARGRWVRSANATSVPCSPQGKVNLQSKFIT